MRTSFTEMVGISAPIVQAPMGGATCPEFAAAVSNAGGLGMLALSWQSREAVRAEIRRTRALTDRPFGVNLILAFRQEERLAVCLEEGVRVVSFFWGDPTPFVAMCHDAGALVTSTVGSASQARAADAAGVDVLVAQGWEAGGHILGEVATLPLVRAVVRAVPDRPVLAAGGIADGQGLAAALALGAAGAWIGTRFLGSLEAKVHRRYRERLTAADETATVYTGLFDLGWPDSPHRVLRNATYDAWLAAGSPPPGARPGEGEAVGRTPRAGDVMRYQAITPDPETEGDIESMSLWAGQSVGGLRGVQPAAEIVREISDDADEALRRLAARLG